MGVSDDLMHNLDDLFERLKRRIRSRPPTPGDFRTTEPTTARTAVHGTRAGDGNGTQRDRHRMADAASRPRSAFPHKTRRKYLSSHKGFSQGKRT